MQLDHTPDAPERIFSWPEVRPMFGGIGRTTAWRLCATGDLPSPIRVSPNRIGWRLSDVLAWQRAKASQTEAA